MLGYAPRPDRKTISPATLGLILAAHVGLLFLMMTAKSGFVPVNPFKPTTVILIDEPVPPPHLPPQPQPDPRPSNSQITTADPIVLPSPGPTVDALPQPLPQAR